MSEITITDISPNGAGIGEQDGQAVLVPYTIPGEIISLTPEGFTLIEASTDRITPPCQHFIQCAGCQWQHMNYEAQLALKTDIVATTIEKVTGIKNPPLQLTLGSPQEWGYAMHATFLPDSEGALGYQDEDDAIFAVQECPIVHPALMALLDELNVTLDTLKSVQLHVNTANERMIVMQTTDDQPPELEITFPASLNFLLSHHEPFNMIGETHIKHQIHDRLFRMTAGVGYRANVAQLANLVDVVLEYLHPQPNHTILDLFGGIGTFSAFIAPLARHVVYVDSYPPAATDAEENLVDLDNIDIIEGRADRVLSAADGSFQSVVLDPPPGGVNHSTMEALGMLEIPTLVYVSQNVETLARDITTLVKDYNYWLVEVQPIDFAPQTTAIECVAFFERRKK